MLAATAEGDDERRAAAALGALALAASEGHGAALGYGVKVAASVWLRRGCDRDDLSSYEDCDLTYAAGRVLDVALLGELPEPEIQPLAGNMLHARRAAHARLASAARRVSSPDARAEIERKVLADLAGLGVDVARHVDRSDRPAEREPEPTAGTTAGMEPETESREGVTQGSQGSPPVLLDTGAKVLEVGGAKLRDFSAAPERWKDVTRLADARRKRPGPDAGFVKVGKKAREDLKEAIEARRAGLFDVLFESRRQLGIRFRVPPACR